MKILSALAILALLPQSFGLQGQLDNAYGHVKPSCDGVPITNNVTLDELVSQGNANDPISIPCGYRVNTVQGNTYDLANGLEVYGKLEFNDNPNSDEETIVKAPYILVRGHLQAGTVEVPFMSKLRFVLTEFGNKLDAHYNLTVDSLSDNDLFKGAMNFGDKAFVVYGGTISLCGPLEKKSIIAKLAKSVKKDRTTEIDVMGKWNKHWKSGDRLVITATRNIKENSYWNIDASEFSISSTELKTYKGKTTTRLSLNAQDLSVEYDSDFAIRKVKTTDYKGKEKNRWMRAEIFKLTRNIVIQGIPVGSDMNDFIGTGRDWVFDPRQSPRGGHFVVAHTPKKTNHTRRRVFCHGSARNPWTLSTSFSFMWKYRQWNCCKI